MEAAQNNWKTSSMKWMNNILKTIAKTHFIQPQTYSEVVFFLKNRYLSSSNLSEVLFFRKFANQK